MDNNNIKLSAPPTSIEMDSSSSSGSLDIVDLHNPSTVSGATPPPLSSCPLIEQQVDQLQLQQQQQLQQQSNSIKNKKLFPQKLWELINDHKYNFCLRWSDDGQLVYLNRDDFEDSYLKTNENQFHTQKAISFVRQMNMYGFRKVDDCYYENDNFKRDCEHLLKNMIRKHPNKSNHHNNNNNNNDQQQHKTNVLMVVPSHHQQHEIPNFLYRSNTINSSSVLHNPSAHNHQQSQHFHHQQTPAAAAAATAASLLATPGSPTSAAPTAFLDTSPATPRLQQTNRNYPLFTGSQESDHDHLNRQRLFQQAAQMSHHAGRHFIADDRLNDDSLSVSSGEYCCSAESSQAETLTNVLDTQFPRDLSTTSSTLPNSSPPLPTSTTTIVQPTDGLLNVKQPQQPDNGNLNAFYALLSTISSNLYQSTPQMPSSHQNLSIDFNRFSNIHQLYQQILAPPSSQSDRSSAIHDNININHKLTGCNTSPVNLLQKPQQINAGKNQELPFNTLASSQLLDHQTSTFTPSSLLVRNKTITDKNNRGSGERLENNGYKSDGCLLGDRSHEQSNAIVKSNPEYSESVTTTKLRRDTKSNRAFKRSVDSILDSNNNSSNTKSSGISSLQRVFSGLSNKRIKLESEKRTKENAAAEKMSSINTFARNLVTQVAYSRDTRVDPSVIWEASLYTERFVETLLDTAQVIARHSNGSGSTSDPLLITDSCPQIEDKELTNDKEVERSNINLSDLTSAIKLLPSKLLKILE